jgi:hypothetical protein
MGFKEQLFKDIGNVFMNPSEFGENHTVDGKIMNVIVDNAEIIERSKKQADSGRVQGIFERQLLFYVSRADIGKLPAVGRMMDFDGKKYRVEDAVDEGAVYSITLGALTS